MQTSMRAFNDIDNRHVRHHAQDGIPELTMGGAFVFWSVATLIPLIVPAGAWLKPNWLVVPFLLAGSGFAAQRLTRILKDWISVPRSGYVEPLPPGKWARAGAFMLAALVSVAVVSVVTGHRQELLSILPLIVSCLLGGGLAYSWRRFHLSNFIWYAVGSVAGGLGLHLWQLGVEWQFGLLYSLVGGMAVVGGSLRLRHYLRTHPLPAERND